MFSENNQLNRVLSNNGEGIFIVKNIHNRIFADILFCYEDLLRNYLFSMYTNKSIIYIDICISNQQDPQRLYTHVYPVHIEECVCINETTCCMTVSFANSDNDLCDICKKHESESKGFICCKIMTSDYLNSYLNSAVFQNIDNIGVLIYV